ncbi:hypothetical protein M9Y10_005637 [Tritrichomonas musculus]|uniref:Uncharacterized protein n=1 Tax=Tritrichomonas musculus TaxID=1915356 RepID=A0ABR2JDH9_9EUKA
MSEVMVLKCTLKVSPKVNSAEKEVVDDILKDYFVCNGVDLVPVCDYDWVEYTKLTKFLQNASDYLYVDGMEKHHIRREIICVVKSGKSNQEWRMVFRNGILIDGHNDFRWIPKKKYVKGMKYQKCHIFYQYNVLLDLVVLLKRKRERNILIFYFKNPIHMGNGT